LLAEIKKQKINMDKKISLKFFMIFCLFLTSCKSDDKLPFEEDVFIFKFQTTVDALNLGCGYYSKEKCSDKKKKEIRKIVGAIGIKEQKDMGDKFHQDLTYPISDDKHKAKRVSKIIDKMRPFLNNQELEYNSFILETSDINAFTIPGGNIYLTTGIIDALQSDDELAYVIGHELGHNENGHTKELARLYKYVEIKENGGTWDYLVSLWTQLRSGYCNQSDEIESDITGIYLAYKAGFDPEKALNAMRVLKSLDTPKPKSDIKKWVVDLLRTHPWTDDRENCLRNYVNNAKTLVKCEKIYDEKKGQVNTKNDPLNVREYPNINAKILGVFKKKEEVKILCDCVKQKNGKRFVYAENKKGLIGWVDKAYITKK